MEDTKEPLGTGNDPATELPSDQGRSMEPDVNAGSTEPSDDLKFDLQTPKGLEKQAKELESQFRQAYLKKTSSIAEERKSIQADKDRAVYEAQHYKTMLEQQKTLLNPQPPQAKEQIPQFQTMEELVNFFDKRAEQKVLSTVDQRVQQYAQTKQYEEKWVSAWNTVADKDPKANIYREMAKDALLNPNNPVLRLYNGTNEVEILQKTVKGFRDIFQKEADAIKQETIQSMKAKKQQSTEKPGKSSQIASTGKLDRASIIAQVNEEFGPPPGL